MPRVKSKTAPVVASKKLKSTKKSIIKTIHPKRKTRSVLVDVIEDEPLNDSAWLEDGGLKMTKNESEINNKIIDDIDKLDHLDNDKIDNQKKFFETLNKEVKNKTEKSEKDDIEYKNHRRVILYRRLVIKFIVLVGIVALVVSYFSFSKLTVTLNLKGETVNESMLLKIVDSNFSATNTVINSGDESDLSASSSSLYNLSENNDPRETIYGTIKEIEARVVKNYPANGETFLGNEIVGRVNIINDYNKSQALVATTRILSPDNKLYRIKNAVNVPAGGEVAVDIYADKPSQEMAIGVTTFTIPGLWVGLQNKIYAKSEAPFTYNQKIQKFINASDLSYAAQDINKALIAAAKAKADISLSSDANWLYTTNDPATITIDAKSGDQKTEFSAEAVGKIVAVSFPKDDVAKLATARLKLIVPDDKDLIDFNPTNIIYSMDSYDSVSRVATVKATFTGAMILKSDSSVISPESLVGLTAEQIGTYLKNQKEISSYSLNFSPSFIKRAPSLVDRIKIIINKN